MADREGVTREVQGQRQRFESRLANALDMAEGEPEVIDVIERSFAAVVPDAPVELLLADNSHAHLLRMAGVGPDGEPPSCSVDSPDRCPAARRAQMQVFADSDHLDACPKLRNRPQGRLSALCVPVSIMGRTVGVIHATDKPQVEVEDSQVQDLTTLAKLAGARIGLLRVMAETQLQASTDTLTGLLNRRSFSEKVAGLPHSLHPVAVAMADLDHFKNLNDTYGHETGRQGAAALRPCPTRLAARARPHFPLRGRGVRHRLPRLLSGRRDPRPAHRADPARRRHHGRRVAEVHLQLRDHRDRAGGGACRRAAPGRRRPPGGEALGAQPGRAARSGHGIEHTQNNGHAPLSNGNAPEAGEHTPETNGHAPATNGHTPVVVEELARIERI